MDKQQDIEAWNKAARNDARSLFEHHMARGTGLGAQELRMAFRRGCDGAYKDTPTQVRWKIWEMALETAKLVDYSKPMSADSIKEIIHRLNVSISELTLAKNTLSSVSVKLKHDQEKLLLAVGNAFDYSSVALCSTIKNVVDTVCANKDKS